MIKADIAVLADGSASGLQGEDSGLNAESLQMLADQFTAMMRKRSAYEQSLLVLNGATGPQVLQVQRFGDLVQTTIDAPGGSVGYEALLGKKQGLHPRGSMAESGRLRAKGANQNSGGQYDLYFSAPVVTRGGSIVGAVAISVDFATLVADLGQSQNNMVFYVADREGRILYRSRAGSVTPQVDGREIALNHFQLSDRWNDWLQTDDLHVQYEMPESALVVDLHRVVLAEGGEAGLLADIIVVGGIASFADVEMKASRFRAQLAVAVLGIGALMILSLVVATGNVVRPIERLTKIANRIASGDCDVVAPVHQKDEIGILARAMMRMADELRRTGKNEEQAAMGRMASMIAHDLRNALSSVKMNLHILHAHHRETNDDYSEGCEIAMNQVKYMEHILNDMLAFARPSNLELDGVDLRETLDTAAVVLLPEVTRKSIDLRNRSDQKLPTVMGDRNKLRQLFENILDNAIQAAPKGGCVVIQARALLHESQPAVEINITDDGPGIASDIADKLFEPFVTTRARGTGLGLAIAHRIVRQHQGWIQLVNGPSGGAIATVILPLSPDRHDSQSTV